MNALQTATTIALLLDKHAEWDRRSKKAVSDTLADMRIARASAYRDSARILAEAYTAATGHYMPYTAEAVGVLIRELATSRELPCGACGRVGCSHHAG